MTHPPAHKGRRVVSVRTAEEWRAWLDQHGAASGAVWLTVWKQAAGPGLLRYDDVVDEALCQGWIDSTVNAFDGDSYLLLVAPRKRGSVWSAPNKARVARLEAEGRMQPAGAEAVAAARADGTWSMLEPVDALEEPDDLASRLDADPALRSAWERSSTTSRKQVLYQLLIAKTEATRTRRLEAALDALAQGAGGAGRRTAGPADPTG